MIGKKLIERRDVSLSHVRSILEKRKKESELSYEQKAAYEYAKSFKLRGIKKTEELIQKLMEINKIDEHLAVMIIDNNPQDEEDLRVLMEKRRHRLTPDEVKQVLDLLVKYAP